jgi:parallel beta-helix repeat protein
MKRLLTTTLLLLSAIWCNAQYGVSLSASPSNLTLPTNSTTLTAIVTPGTSVTPYKVYFTKLFGSKLAVITTPYKRTNSTTITTTITNMTASNLQYVFQVQTYDKYNRLRSDTVKVMVNGTPPSPPSPPTLIAHPDTSISTSSCQLYATGTPSGGSYLWTKISGSTQGTVLNATSQNASIESLVDGTYKVMCQYSTANGIAKDTVSIVVSSAPVLGTFYFSSTLGDDSRTPTQAQNAATPWKNITKLNSYFSSLATGNNVVFKRGDIFYGTIVPTKGGINFGAYGSGAKPNITGFTTISSGSFTNVGTNLWEASVTSATPIRIVSFADTLTPMGRTPNATGNINAFYYYTVNSGSQFVVTGLSGTWTGATMVYRGQRWIYNQVPVTSNSGTTVNFTPVSGTPYPGLNNYGCFMQNHNNTLDQNGEWCFNASTNKIRIFYSSTPPSIKCATLSNAALVTSAYDNITFTDINFTGYNDIGLSFANSDALKFNRCDFSLMGKDAIKCPAGNLDTVMNCTIRLIGSNGITLDNSTNTYLYNNTIEKTALYPGLISNGDGTGYAVKAEGAGVLAEYNNVVNNGYVGLSISGANSTTRYNFIDSFCSQKDDGAGYYVRSFGLNSNTLCDHNIILHGIGAQYGTDDTTYIPAMGIYLDAGSNNFTISNNSVYQVAMHGIFLNDGYDNQFLGNNTYTGISSAGFPRGFLLKNGDVATTGMTVKNNKTVVGLNTTILFGGQNLYTYEITSPSRINVLGTLDSNYYCRPLNEPTTLWVGSNISLATFKATYSKELASGISPQTVATLNDVRFIYNRTTSPVNTSLGANYLTIPGSVVNNVTVQPYESVTLIKQ